MSSVGSRTGLTGYPNGRIHSPSSCTEEFEYPNESHPLHPYPRRPSSYEEMSGSGEYTPDGHHHQYEDPRLLARQIRDGPPPCKSEITVKPRKKTNELYERCRTDSNGSESSTGRRVCCRDAMCFLVSLSFVFAVGALALVILVILGHLVTVKCGKCLDEVHPNSPVSGASTMNAHTERMMKMIRELQANLTSLNRVVQKREEVIKELLLKEKTHGERLVELAHKPTTLVIRNAKYNMSKLRGAPGPRGPAGIPGPPGKDGKPGNGNISACVYKMGQTKFSPSAGSGHDVLVNQPRGWLIISATCSTEGASESNLVRYKRADNNVQYQCQCRGRSTVTRRGAATCNIHYWLCPKLS